MQENRIDFTEESNAIDYLEKAYYFLTLIKQEPTNWKWVILALHGALYGFAICALQGAHYELVYRGIKLQKNNRKDVGSQKEKSRKNCWRSFLRLLAGADSQKKKSKTKFLESLDSALRKCQNSQIMSRFICGRPLVLTTSQKASIEKMKQIRNSFAHYEPRIWIILTECLPHISNDVLDVILFLATKTGTNPHVVLKRNEIERLIGDCKAALKEMD
ncbi:MAG: hypothetical protein OXU94_05070 [Gammaproteobacteria bacterium]|nr:hypothetical protein [Gammaproteobacteria bacterium]